MSEPQQNEQIDPFVKRVVIVHPGDRVVFKVLIATSEEEFADIKAKLEEKMGDIPILVIGPDIDITVLKPPPRAPGVFIA